VTVVSGTIGAAVTALFVPGDRPERFAKAAESGADVVIIDLEDSIAAGARERALQATVSALMAVDGIRAFVRIDASQVEVQLDQLEELVGRPEGRLQGVVVPKSEHPAELALVGERLGGLPVVALIETARGVTAVDELAAAPGVVRLALGAIDLGLDLDATASAVLDYARTRLVIASRATGLPAPLDSPSPAVRDMVSVEAAAVQSRTFGFGGMLCIHPAQVAVVDEAFRPSAEELAWARRVVAAPEGVSELDGEMVDRPVLDRARRILDRVVPR
jgi:citrate lyase beta subunit